MDNIKVLLNKEKIEKRLSELGDEISRDYSGLEITVVVVLTGAFMTASTLIQYISGNIKIEFTRVKSYGSGYTSSGKLSMLYDISKSLKNKNILIIEDIVDTGYTLKYLKEEYLKRGAKSVKICALLNKPSRRQVELSPDYIGFEIEDKFVVGFGLDYDDKFRNLPFIGYIDNNI